MRRISVAQERFEAAQGETITVTVRAVNTPHEVTFSDLTVAQWTDVSDPPPEEVKRFVMPSSRDSFAITYKFPPASHQEFDARYVITLEGRDGTSDGPNPVLPITNPVTLLYEFRLESVGAGVPVMGSTRGLRGAPPVTPSAPEPEWGGAVSARSAPPKKGAAKKKAGAKKKAAAKKKAQAPAPKQAKKRAAAKAGRPAARKAVAKKQAAPVKKAAPKKRTAPKKNSPARRKQAGKRK